MPNDAFTQPALASDARFRQRLENALGKVAWEARCTTARTLDLRDQLIKLLEAEEPQALRGYGNGRT